LRTAVWTGEARDTKPMAGPMPLLSFLAFF